MVARSAETRPFPSPTPTPRKHTGEGQDVHGSTAELEHRPQNPHTASCVAASAAARRLGAKASGRGANAQPQEELTQLAQLDDSDDTRFRDNTATNTQPALALDGSPEVGARADPTGVATEAAGEGTTPWREDKAARC